ncbi:MAG: PorV/PorQ family protein [Candidatus Cloacimonetes bacterium]|nr:PorV/PorQ family protein [Candidatus Cloacimonadota bacterium]MDD4155463.1 PorV/PorQ family protein [Candidatus Cloacimonadota bacterium]
MKKLIIIISILIMIYTVNADNLSNIESAFIDIGLGARGIGMGGAYSAISKDANSMIWNPSGMVLNQDRYCINFDYADLYGLYRYSFFGLSGFINEGIASGVGMLYSGDDSMNETSIYLSGAILGSYANNYVKFMPKKLTLGMNIRILLSSYGNNSDGAWYDENNLNHQVQGNAKGYAVDLGLNYLISEKDRIAMVMKNTLGSISWDSKNDIGTAEGKYSEGLPTNLTFGYARTENKFIVAVDINKALHSDTEDYLLLGIEYNLFKELMDLRAGYSQEMNTGLNRKYSFGTGFHINLGKNIFDIDMSYQIHTEWEKHNTLRLSCGIGI